MASENFDFIYGVNPVFEVIRSGKRKSYKLFLSTSSANNPRIQKLRETAENYSVPVEWLEKGRLIDASGSHEHQGAVLQTSLYPYEHFNAVIADARKLLLLDNIEDPHNVGAILRTAEIFDFKNILLPERGVPGIYPAVVKAAAGATEYLRIARELNAVKYARKAIEAGCRIIALDAGGTARVQDCENSFDDNSPVMLVIGGENKGIHQYILNNADERVFIPQAGQISSLNASVAAGIAMFSINSKCFQGDYQDRTR